MRRPRRVALAAAALLFATGPARGQGEPRPAKVATDPLRGPPRLVVCAARDAPAARVAAEDVARALAPVAPIRLGAAGASCNLDGPGERVALVVDAEDDRVVLSARGRAGRAWSPRTVERGDGGASLLREHVAVAARSLASAALDAEASTPVAAPDAPPPATDPVLAPAPAPRPPAAPPPVAPPAPRPKESAAPVSSTSTADRGESPPTRAPPLLRLEAGYVAVTLGSAIPVESGVSIAGFWLAPHLRLGAAYAFFPAATASSSDATLAVTRHALDAYVGAAYRAGDFELGGAAGPLLDVWLRSTESTTGVATAPASIAAAGFALRADGAYALGRAFGVHAALSAEVAPASPTFRGPSGIVLDPAIFRGRLDAGLTLSLP